MKFIKMNVIRNDELSDWWYKIHHPLFNNVLIGNENKAPKRQYNLKLKRGGYL